MSNNVPTQTPDTLRCVIRLFICGDAINSRKALENLQRLREAKTHITFEVEIIDVNRTPQVALDLGVFVNPALQVLEPAPGMLIYGDLSDLQALDALLPRG